ncbi:MFS transporter [Sphaerisporangium aureirubrum]|uniref:MFS transporter n=1 Tax=Sphaerisporangium aureirubrum TaxID=1544736 RepID=A0ABW1NTU0_9ACTN
MAPPVSGFRAFTVLWCGQFVSLTGSALSGFALGVYVYQVTGSATALGLVYALSALPFVLASPFTGSLVDRIGARRAMLAANAGSLIAMLVLAAALFADASAVWPVCLVVACLSVLAALQMPAFEASVPLLVPKQQLGRANGMRLIAVASSQVLAPVAAGFLLIAIGIDGIILMDCVSFGAAILALLWVRIPLARRSGEAAAGAAALLKDFWVAWRYVAARRGLLGLLAFVAALEFCAGVVDVSITPLVLAFASSGALGTILTVGGIGMVAGSLAMTAWGGPRRRVRAILGCSLVLAAAIVAGSTRPDVVLVAIAAFVFFAVLAVVIGSNQSLWQSKVEPHLLGRVIALRNMIASVPRLLAFGLAGLAADTVFLPLAGRDRVRSPFLAGLIGDGPGRGVALLMMVMGLLLALCAVVAYLSPRLRHLEDELPDVTPEDVTPGGAAADPREVPEPWQSETVS